MDCGSQACSLRLGAERKESHAHRGSCTGSRTARGMDSLFMFHIRVTEKAVPQFHSRQFALCFLAQKDREGLVVSEHRPVTDTDNAPGFTVPVDTIRAGIGRAAI